MVSIHAPARGATEELDPPGEVRKVSIHAPARGATDGGHIHLLYPLWFQSTLPHGERPSSMGTKYDTFLRFNPRSRTGSDPRGPAPPPQPARFNPRSRTGSDNLTMSLGSMPTSFQSTLPHGERRPVHCVIVKLQQFQSTLPHGERQGSSYCSWG